MQGAKEQVQFILLAVYKKPGFKEFIITYPLDFLIFLKELIKNI